MSKQSLSSQTHELLAIWDELISLYPRLRTTMPADLARAKARLRQVDSHSDVKSFGEHHIFVFYRIGTLFDRHTEPMTMRELGEALGVPFSTATHIVDSFVEPGYIKRWPDPEDRRIVRVAFTAAGKRLYATFNEFFNQRVEEFLHHFTAEERASILALTQKAVQVFKEITIE